MTTEDTAEKLEALLRRTAASLIKSERKLESERAARREPIAVVAMACRMPGGIDTPEGYWELLAAGGDAIEPFPERWRALEIYDPNPDAVGKSYVAQGGFIHGSDRFDAEFFGVLPREARAMDPQQRLLMQVSWEALERAGIVPSSLLKSPTGVYVGSSGSDYLFGGDFSVLDGYALTGNTSSVLSGRLSYFLGLQGPSLTVDTACSSSLVALHLACNGLRNKECDLALAAGVTVMSRPGLFVEFSRLRALSPDARCKSFSAHANGAVWSEACVVLVLKRLSDAQRDGHRILATLRGTAVNHDGRSQGLTAPNGPAQQRVIRDALSASQLTPADIDAVEAHGTGTPLGDPIEAGALAEVFGPARAAERPVWLGSSKSNVGHSIAAAGLVGVMKMVLALERELMPRTLHATDPSPHVDWQSSGLALLQDARPWQRSQRVRRAGVSSFGISGTNVHVVLEEAPLARAGSERAPAIDALDAGRTLPLIVSGRDGRALQAQARRLAAWLSGAPNARINDVASAAARHRARFESCAAIAASSTADAVEALAALAEDRPHPLLVHAQAGAGGKLAVLFTGQGSQRPEMGRRLYQTHATFRGALDEVASALDVHLEHPILDLMFGAQGTSESALLEQTAFTQPALFALEVALYRQWEAWGVQPFALLGHSIGELSAAHVAGVLTLADAAKLVCARGRLMQACETGAMASVEASEQEVTAALASIAGRIDIAALNAPQQTVVSGDEQAVMALVKVFSDQGRGSRRLRVSHAFHSAHMDAMLAQFARVAEDCSFSPPRLPIVSLVTGKLAQAQDVTSPAYWVRQVRAAVRFVDGVRALHAEGVTTYLECGPDGVLAAQAVHCVPEGVRTVASLRRAKDEPRTLAQAVGLLDAAGERVDWSCVLPGAEARAHELPTYAFQEQRYWFDDPGAASRTSAGERKLLEALRSGDAQEIAEVVRLPRALRPALELLSPYLSAPREAGASQLVGMYAPVWKPLDAPRAGEGVSLIGTWCVAAPARAEALARRISAELRARGASVVILVSDGDRSRLEAAVLELKATQTRGVIALGATDAAPTGEWGGLAEAVIQTLALLQALEAREVDAPIWLVTQGAVAAYPDEEQLDPLQAPIWGLGRVLALEQPHRFGALVDLPKHVDDQTAQQLCTLLSTAPREREFALRDGRALVLRLEDARAAMPQVPWTVRSTVLITGGSGALAAQLARWVAAKGAEHVVLASRRGGSAPGAAELRDELQATGVRVTLAVCDVTERTQLGELLESLKQDAAPLRAVFHAAGVVEDALLTNLTPDSVVRVIDAKATSAWHLHHATLGLELDAFVLFSSMAGLLGNPGQAHYAGANVALDALAAFRRAQGLPALSVAWGPWDGGMVSAEVAAELARRGLLTLRPDEALQCLEQALGSSAALIGIAAFDWPRLSSVLGATRAWPLVSEVAAGPTTAHTAQDADSLVNVTPEQRVSIILAKLREWVCSAVERDDIAPDTNLLGLGVDSLTTLELVNRIRNFTGVVIYPREVIQNPTLAQLSAYIADQVSRKTDAAGPVTTQEPVIPKFRDQAYRVLDASQRLPSITFVLSAPRAGSTLLRAMLAGHSGLFSPPELHLLPFEDMAERAAVLAGSYADEGLVRAYMELLGKGASEAAEYVARFVKGSASIRDVYRDLQQLAGERSLVDKSPTYSFRSEVLDQAENLFQGAKYIHLVRHPYAVIESFCRMRMDKLMGFAAEDPLAAGELIWLESNANALRFGEQLAAPERYLRVFYEDLVEQPEAELRKISGFLGVPFEPAMLKPYERGRMTDGVHAASLPIGDQNFHKHRDIDAQLSSAWRGIHLPRALTPRTVTLCDALGYELPRERVSQIAVAESLRSEQMLTTARNELCVSTWGPQGRPSVLCLHGYGDQGPVWEELATCLVAEGYYVIAPDLRGHGLSAHGPEGLELLELVLDIDALCTSMALDNTRVIGHSMGTIVAATYAAYRPARVCSLGLIEPILPGSGGAKVSERLARALELRKTRRAHRPFASEEEALARFASMHPTMPPQLAGRLARRLVVAREEGYVWRSDPNPPSIEDWISRADYLALLRELRAPTTVVFASGSDRIRSEDALAVKSGLRSATFLTLSGTHNLHYERGRELAAAMLDQDTRRAAE